jgi:hypothetical protein
VNNLTHKFVTLGDIAHRYRKAPEPRVPAWAIGTVRRRSITFATGAEDTKTFVVWIQSHGMTGDLRIHPVRPELSMTDRLEELDHQSLVWLASVEGGAATTSWSDGVMSWKDWTGFQPYDKYPEPGIMRRVGDCMIEFAPTGIYVEDWRFLQSKRGPVAGLRLVSETTHDGREYPRAGGYVVAGDHALLSLARRQELPNGTRAQDFVGKASNPVKALQRVLDCTVDYSVKRGDRRIITVSTDPRRQGMESNLLETLTLGPSSDVLVEHVIGEEGVRSRLWCIDSLELAREFNCATEAPDNGMAWLQREADTLLNPIAIATDRAA